ncbi:hypothetical protein [Amycolatopsis sp. WQ 127309]|uniref:PGAP1-like alpha/beta domain-containing protein n=1 Tax=Amycolatopsis sp. WQ 127309 TaxID=2932773 RepID=UPI00353051BE
MPVTGIVLIGHSMGGLVARSALYQAQEQLVSWLPRVTGLVCLSTPRNGAPSERRVARPRVSCHGRRPARQGRTG